MKFSLAIAMCPPDQILDLARAAEETGWDAVAVPDSVFYPKDVSASYPFTADGQRFWKPETPFVDPYVAIPAMAAVTERIHFYTNVYKSVLRHPLLVAKTVGSAAAMSGNRVGIGLGSSWIPEEFAWLDQDMSTRGKRLDETIEILRAVFAGGYAEYHGAQYDFDALAMSPAPTGPVPIYIGGHSDAALRRAARVGDGWIGAQMTAEEFDATMVRLRRQLAEYDRDESGFEVKFTPLVAPDPDAMGALADAGATDIITAPWFYYEGNRRELSVKLESIRRFADEVIMPLWALRGAN